mmetsp:Transcript_46145/g.120910  ORF Transcript_46145/g.120910 Transcript_46145/m.120910 type:complete len:216 (+) Transcript_46145:306-953(+)
MTRYRINRLQLAFVGALIAFLLANIMIVIIYVAIPHRRLFTPTQPVLDALNRIQNNSGNHLGTFFGFGGIVRLSDGRYTVACASQTDPSHYEESVTFGFALFAIVLFLLIVQIVVGSCQVRYARRAYQAEYLLQWYASHAEQWCINARCQINKKHGGVVGSGSLAKAMSAGIERDAEGPSRQPTSGLKITEVVTSVPRAAFEDSTGHLDVEQRGR